MGLTINKPAFQCGLFACLPMKTNDLRCQGRIRTAVQGFADPYLASRPLDLKKVGANPLAPTA